MRNNEITLPMNIGYSKSYIVHRTYRRQQTMSSNLTVHCIHFNIQQHQAVTVDCQNTNGRHSFAIHSQALIYD